MGVTCDPQHNADDQYLLRTTHDSPSTEAGRGRDAVTVATAHAAKGRQWRHVHVARLNEDMGCYHRPPGKRL